MVAIERQDDLRSELAGLIERDLVRSNGPLERRGIEVDHCLYEKPPTMAFSEHTSDAQNEGDELAADSPVSSAQENTARTDVDRSERISNLESICEQLTKDNAAMQREFHELEQAVSAVTRQVQKLTDEWNA
jgi:polyhydroxyalkanoate synthesis regulator phasin